MLSVSENDSRAMIELSGVSSEVDSSDDEKVEATVSSRTLKKSRCSSSSYYYYIVAINGIIYGFDKLH